jgi:hypothetical protein
MCSTRPLGPLRVNRVGLAAFRLLPLYPNERTSLPCVGISEMPDAGRLLTRSCRSCAAHCRRQVAMETLLLVAERDGPEMLARIAVMRALNRHSTTAKPAPRRKPAKVFRIVR